MNTYQNILDRSEARLKPFVESSDFDSIHHVKANAHLYQFYKSIEDYVNVLSVFFRTGLAKGDACLWLVSSSMNLDRVQALASRMIPNFMLHLCTGQLVILSAEDWYLSRARFDESKSIKNAKAFLEQSLQKGYKRIRACGDIDVIPRKDRQAFGAYEKKLHEATKTWPAIVVCAYPILKISLSETRAILNHHDHMMVGHHLF